MIVQVSEGEPIFRSLDNSSEARDMSFILPLSLGSFQLRHHGIVTCGKQIYPFVPHSHANFHFWCFRTFVLLSPPWLLSFWILIQDPLSIVSFCVRDTLILTHGQRKNLTISFILMGLSMCFLIHIFPLGDFDSF